MKIKKLPDVVIASIAAGEVIDRPSYVLKELLENSCDSNSSKVSVFIENCGLDLIRVVDDGDGISRDDLLVSIFRFTTSKIFSLDDLKCIKTYGFRGEALYYISSMSKFEIISKTKTQSLGWKLEFCESNKCFSLKPAASNFGTTVIVKDLFYNLLSKRLFLENSKLEFRSLDFVFKSFSLCRFDVHFTLTNNNRELRNYPVCHSHYSKVKRIEAICGIKFISNSIYVDNVTSVCSLSGFISRPGFVSNNSFFYFFLNNRLVNDKLINVAVRDAFFKFSDFSVKPNCCLYFFIDCSLYNINVHPKKSEVKFMDPSFIYDFIYKTLVSCFAKENNNYPILNNKKFLLNKNEFNYDKSVEADLIYVNYYAKFFNSKYEKIFISSTDVLALIENTFLFFKVNCNVFFVNIVLLINKIISDSFFCEIETFFCLRSQRLIDFFCEDVVINFDISFCLKFFEQMGFFFENSGDGFFVLKRVPVVVFGFVFDWNSLVLKLSVFFNSYTSVFIFNKDIYNKILFIFLNSVLYNRSYYVSELNNFYKILFDMNINNDKWFLKNCFKISF